MTRTLHVRVDDSPERSDLIEDLEAIDDGDEIPARDSTLSVESTDTLGRIFRTTNLELLRAISEHEPESIRALARAVDRHPPDVLENITELEDYGLVELREENGAKRPVLWYDNITVDISLPPRSESENSAVAP